MIRMEKEEFFIEPVEKGEEVIAEGETEGGGGRTHIVYRSSAVKKAAVSGAAADFHSRGQCAHHWGASPTNTPPADHSESPISFNLCSFCFCPPASSLPLASCTPGLLPEIPRPPHRQASAPCLCRCSISTAGAHGFWFSRAVCLAFSLSADAIKGSETNKRGCYLRFRLAWRVGSRITPREDKCVFELGFIGWAARQSTLAGKIGISCFFFPLSAFFSDVNAEFFPPSPWLFEKLNVAFRALKGGWRTCFGHSSLKRFNRVNSSSGPNCAKTLLSLGGF